MEYDRFFPIPPALQSCLLRRAPHNDPLIPDQQELPWPSKSRHCGSPVVGVGGEVMPCHSSSLLYDVRF